AVIVADPGPTALTRPLPATTVATDPLPELQAMPGVEVTSRELPSLKIPTDRNCTFVRFPIFRTGRTISFDSELSSTFAVVVSLTEPELALILAEPRPNPVTRPAELTRAIVGFDVVQ